MTNDNIPTVPSWEFYKNSLKILENPLIFHHKKFEKLGDTFRLKIGPGKSVIFSRNAGFAQYALQKNQKNFIKTTIQTEDMAKYLGKGLLTAEGEHWKKQRRLIQPGFHKKQLVHLLDSIKSAIDVELEKIETDKEMDIFPVFNDLAFQTVVKALFSSAVNQEEINRLQYITEAAQKMLVKELRQPYLGWYFSLSGKIKEHIALTNEAREILQRIINDRKKSGKRENDLLDMLLEAKYEDGSSMENKQLLDEILILFTAGHETTSNALTFTAQLLARHPQDQEKIYREVQTAVETATSQMEFLQQLEYTKMAIEEAMRLFPPAYFIDRVNLEEDEFEGMKVPPNSSLLFSMYEIHRNPAYWKDPEDFIPERFRDSRQHSSNYFPFGAGPRMCIGNNFAMYEMIMAVAELVRKYKVSSNPEPVKILPLITLKPKQAILKFELRNRE